MPDYNPHNGDKEDAPCGIIACTWEAYNKLKNIYYDTTKLE